MCFRVRSFPIFAFLALTVGIPGRVAADSLQAEAETAMKRAAAFFRANASVRGGYVYYYALDFSQRWGEGEATKDQIFVQPPWTPTVGMAFLRAHEATDDAFYLDAARETAEALVYGQLESGGWAQVIDFDPKGKKAGQYRNGKSRGRNQSTLDDGATQSALRFLMHADRALGFKHAAIHEAVEFGRKSLLGAQHPNGAFPQGWRGPAPQYPAVRASFPDYDWRTGQRIKEYWDLPTLNDGLCGSLTLTLEDAVKIHGDEGCRKALLALGDFLILAQMPEPQPAWAQQYTREMRPAWARKFEPPAVAGRESIDAIRTLLRIHRFSGDPKYLEPVPRAVAWLKRSLLPDGQLARFYELQTNKPLYMTSDYQLTFDDSDVPKHYGWKSKVNLDALERDFEQAKAGKLKADAPRKANEARVRSILSALEGEGRWVSTKSGLSLTGQPKFSEELKIIASEVFCENVESLSAWIASTAEKR
jgi:PelA/Pel-15E family pectate lyase